jgi:hypothetical protein
LAYAAGGHARSPPRWSKGSPLHTWRPAKRCGLSGRQCTACQSGAGSGDTHRESQQQARLAHARVTDQQHLEEIITVAARRWSQHGATNGRVKGGSGAKRRARELQGFAAVRGAVGAAHYSKNSMSRREGRERPPRETWCAGTRSKSTIASLDPRSAYAVLPRRPQLDLWIPVGLRFLWVCVGAPPHGWNLTEISVGPQNHPTQGNFDAGLPRSAKFSEGSPITGRPQPGCWLTGILRRRTHFHPSGLPVGVILLWVCVFPRESINPVGAALQAAAAQGAGIRIRQDQDRRPAAGRLPGRHVRIMKTVEQPRGAQGAGPHGGWEAANEGHAHRARGGAARERRRRRQRRGGPWHRRTAAAACAAAHCAGQRRASGGGGCPGGGAPMRGRRHTPSPGRGCVGGLGGR